jgi:hypothetical protein
MVRVKSQFPLGLPETDRLEADNDSKNKLRDLFKRWDNRLSLQGKSLLEQYIGGRLSLVVDVDFIALGKCSAPTDRAIGVAELNRHCAFDNEGARFVFYVNARQRCNVEHWNEQFVFVENVEAVKSADRGIPSFVRLYDINYVFPEFAGDALMYYSTFASFYKFLPRAVGLEWKADVSEILGGTTHCYGVADQQIECTSKIVDSVTNDGGRILGNGSQHPELQDVLSGIRIVFNDKFVEVSVNERLKNRVKLKDMLIGPFNL